MVYIKTGPRHTVLHRSSVKTARRDASRLAIKRGYAEITSDNKLLFQYDSKGKEVKV